MRTGPYVHSPSPGRIPLDEISSQKAFRHGRAIVIIPPAHGTRSRGSLLPDLDMVYFYLVDLRQHLHHGYVTHVPLFWFVLFCSALAAGAMLKKPSVRAASVILFSNVFIHLGLDSIVGKVRWLAPLSNSDFVLFEVPAGHGWWVWNFVLHWTFLFEVGLVVGAALVLMGSIGKGKRPAGGAL